MDIKNSVNYKIFNATLDKIEDDWDYWYDDGGIREATSADVTEQLEDSGEVDSEWLDDNWDTLEGYVEGTVQSINDRVPDVIANQEQYEWECRHATGPLPW